MYKQNGVTLMELLIVVVVIGILAAIAMPSYRQYMIRTNRTVAKVELTKMAQQLERCFTRKNTFVDCGGTSFDTTIATATTQDGNYDISVTPNGTTGYAVKATAKAGQLKDTECKDITLDDKGVVTVTGTAGTNAQAKCWGR